MPSSFFAVSNSSRIWPSFSMASRSCGGIFDGLLQRDVQLGRDHLGDAVDVGVRNVHGAANVFDRGFRGHGAEGDDLRDVVAAVFLRDVLDDFAAAVHAEIDVDIGHGHALGIQEALEEQFVLQRIDVGDAERVGDERAGGRSAAGADGDVVLAGVADEVPDDQEIAGELHLLDDARVRAPGAARSRRWNASACLARASGRSASRRRAKPSRVT